MVYTPVPDFHDAYVITDYKAARKNLGYAEWKLKELVRTRGVHLTQAELDAAIAEYQLMRTRLLEIQPHVSLIKETYAEIPPTIPTVAPVA